jgi:hypothetical protein
MIATLVLLEQWHLDVKTVRQNVYRAATPRERERGHAPWLSARGSSNCDVATALDRDPDSIEATGWTANGSALE